MKKPFLGLMLLALLVGYPLLSAARDMEVPLPPPISFAGPPDVIVLPGLNIYAVPDVDAEIYFQQGWWWRLWNGRWYRSPYYDRGWVYYPGSPGWYGEIPHRWREDYRRNYWRGNPHQFTRIPHGDLDRHGREGHMETEHGRDRPGGREEEHGRDRR
ncbi:MAG TPA: hypothetical protein VK564_01445 [Thermodesulfobacteriota bacterium]|nr:hypothetical protein [Thermodesulfobacteriota bacterium]